MINHHGFYLIRRPAKSIDLLSNFHQQRTDRSAEELLMGYYMGDLLLREAILIASPSLYERFQKWIKGETVTEKQHLLATLYKYLIRTTTRCTPFGLFSSCATGELAAHTNVTLALPEKPIKKVAPDIEIIKALGEWLTQLSTTRKQLRLFPNTSLYKTGNHYRYIERADHQGQSQYFISALEQSEALSLILDRSASGATIPELVLMLATHGNDCAESLEFVDLLIDNQILEFDTQPKIAGSGSLRELNLQLSLLHGGCDVKEQMNNLQHLMDSRQHIVKTHKILHTELSKLKIHPDKANILKVDSYFTPIQNQLATSAVTEIGDIVNRLLVLNQGKLPADLKNFKERFSKKFGSAEVSLALALDDDIGIGYGDNSSLGIVYAPMIDELDIKNGEDSLQVSNSWWQQFVLGKYVNALLNGQREIKLTSRDIDTIRDQKESQQKDTSRLAGSFFVFGNIIAKSASAIDSGDFMFNLLACQGPSAVNMLCRFADGIPGLEAQLKACTKLEESKHPGVIFAEIIHYPDNKAGNILTRPNLYRYQIPYLGQASVSRDFQIPIDDIMVSIRDNEIVLRSKRLNKRIIPRLSSMHNYRKGLPVYRFLCDLQEQDANLNIFWDWGLLVNQQYLPRVTFDKLILNRETWIVQSKALLPEAPQKTNDTGFKNALTTLGLPSTFVVVSGDNELFINVNVEDSLDLLIELCRKNDSIKIMEFLGSEENCWVANGKERFVSEFVFPFHNPDISEIPGFSIPDCEIPASNFLFGSEWLFVKIYAGEKSNDSLLISTLYPLICKLLEKRTIQQFFFVRYNDPDPHLRLRFRGNPESRFYSQVLESLHAAILPMLKNGGIHNIQTDNYVRELERYGWQHIHGCEQLFEIDSLDTMRFLAEAKREESERFLFAIRKIDTLLSDVNYDLQRRRVLLERLKEGFFKEFKGDTALRKKLNANYQRYKFEISEILQTTNYTSENTQKELITRIASEEKDSDSILSSLIHMSVNRLFPSKQRVYEMMLYHCLFKHYDAVLSRMNQKNQVYSDDLLPTS